MTDSTAAERRLRVRLAAATVAAVLAFALALLVGPRIADEAIARDDLYVANVRFTPTFGLSLNKDFVYYLAAAQHPARLLERDVLQSRPLLPVVLAPFVADRDPQVPGGNVGFTFPEITRGVFVFAFANVLLVLAGFAFARRYGQRAHEALAMSPAQSFAARVALAAGVLMLLFNALGSSFLLQPHAQMFTIAAAGAITAWAHHLCTAERIASRSLVLAGLAFGIGILGYGAFAMTPGVLALSCCCGGDAALLALRWQDSSRSSSSRSCRWRCTRRGSSR